MPLNHTTTITRTCPFCGKSVSMEFDTYELAEGQARLNEGALIQDAYPNFTPSQREFLHTGICDECWENLQK